MGLKLLHGLRGVVDEGEASGLAATELGAQTEDGDLILLGLVQAGELVAELLLRDVGAVGVEDVPVRQKARQSAHILPKLVFFPFLCLVMRRASFVRDLPMSLRTPSCRGFDLSLFLKHLVPPSHDPSYRRCPRVVSYSVWFWYRRGRAEGLGIELYLLTRPSACDPAGCTLKLGQFEKITKTTKHT